MNSLVIDERSLDTKPTHAEVTKDQLAVDLEDGRTIMVPTEGYPRLVQGTRKEWMNYELSALGVHWPDLDEDLSVRGLLLGQKSGESSASFEFWLNARRKNKKVTLADFVKHQRKLRQKHATVDTPRKKVSVS